MDNYFGEDVAAGYDATIGEWRDPQIVGAAVATVVAIQLRPGS